MPAKVALWKRASIMARARARVWLPVLTVLALSACGGVTSVDDNRTVVCDKVASIEGAMGQAVALASPDVPIATGREGVQIALARSDIAAGAMSAPQRQLLDRYTRALTDYDNAMAALPDGATFGEYDTGLDAYKANVLVTYGTMLTTIGCPLPALYDNFPRSA